MGHVQMPGDPDHCCKGCNGPTSAQGSSGYSGGGQDFRTEMLKNMVGAALAAMFAPTDNSQQEQQKKLQQLKDEKERKAALQRYEKLKSEEELKKKMDDADRMKQGAALLSQMQTVGSGGKVEPYSIGNPKLDIKSVSQNTYPTSGLKAYERLLCSAYFSNLAKKSTKDIEAQFYAEQAQKVMSGERTDCECRMPQVSNDNTAKRMEAVNKLYGLMSAKINDLKDVERQIQDSKNKIKKAEEKKSEATVKLNELQNLAVTAGPEEKAKDDDLVRLAQEQSKDADQEISQAQQEEKDGLNKQEQLEKEYDNLQSQMKSNIRGD
jgi:hypothetical protein